MPWRRFRRRWPLGGGLAGRAALVLAAVGCCLAAAAYAARGPGAGAERQRRQRPLVPRLTGHPDAVTSARNARFDFGPRARPPARARRGSRPLEFECRLDRDAWNACRAPVRVTGLRHGRHRFRVRAVNAAGRWGRAAVFSWRVRSAAPVSVLPPPRPPRPAAAPAPPPGPEGEGLPFSIVQIAPPADLYPGAPAQPLALRVENPNPVPIEVTSLEASLAEDPPVCPAAENFVLIPSGASATTPLVIPARAGVTLPAQGISAPQIAMRDLPVSQDGCQGADLDLVFDGEARG